MPLKMHHLLLSGSLALANVAMAEPARALAISVDYLVAEQSPERLEEVVADVCARAMFKVPGATKVNSRFNHGSFSIEIIFEKGADAADVAVVEHEMDRLRLGDKLEIASRSIRLAQPRPEHAFK